MSGALDTIQRIEVFFEPRETEAATREIRNGQYGVERKLIGSIEIKDEDGWEIGKPRLSQDGSLQVVAIREDQVKEWVFPRDKWDRYEIAATRKAKQ